MYLTYPNEDTMEEDFLEQTRGRDIQLFVVSDAEAILGIGDQGVGVCLCVLHEVNGLMTDMAHTGYRRRFTILQD